MVKFYKGKTAAEYQRDYRKRCKTLGYNPDADNIRLTTNAYIQYKQSHPCKDCGFNYPSYMMDFDHVPEKGTKLFGIQERKSHFLGKTVQQEVEKCDLVCRNCHARRTFLRLQNL